MSEEYWIDCPIQALIGLYYFGIETQSHHEMLRYYSPYQINGDEQIEDDSPSFLASIIGRGKTLRHYVKDKHYQIIQPQEMDCGIDEFGNICQFLGEEWKSKGFDFCSQNVIITFRDNKPFPIVCSDGTEHIRIKYFSGDK